MDQQAMGEIGVKLGLDTYNTFSKEGNTYATFVKCFNDHIMLQISNSKKIKVKFECLD